MYYSRLVLSIYLEEKEDQSSYLECIKPYKKPSIDGFFFKPYFIHLVTMVEAR